ncbi:MAG TPA: cytochrome c-type biogenesis protein [Azospira sp.]|nr:cytochrome c-type biogenesis protein [Azospira sp.]
MKRLLSLVVALWLGTLALSATAREAAPLADDPLTEKRLLAITAELRCLVCQNQTIADSNADLANDFRREIRKLIAEGKSDHEIMEFMVTRYGDFVRYRPPLKGTTILLWAGPGVLLLIGLTVLVRYLRRRNDAISDAALTPEELKAAEALLAAADPDSKKPQ